jgi:hypothetical protein
LRILEIVISKHSEEEFDKILSSSNIVRRWKYLADSDQMTSKVENLVNSCEIIAVSILFC